MKKMLMMVMMVGMSFGVFAGEKKWSVNIEGGTYTADADVSASGVNHEKSIVSSDTQTEMQITLGYKFNDHVSVFAGFIDGLDLNGWFDTQDLWYNMSYDMTGYGIILGGKYDFLSGFFVRAGIGIQKTDAEYDLDRYITQGGGSSRGIESGVNVDVDDSLTADLAIGYQFFPENAFSFGVTAGYRYMEEVTAGLPMGYSVTVDNSNPYVAANISIKW